MIAGQRYEVRIVPDLPTLGLCRWFEPRPDGRGPRRAPGGGFMPCHRIELQAWPCDPIVIVHEIIHALMHEHPGRRLMERVLGISAYRAVEEGLLQYLLEELEAVST